MSGTFDINRCSSVALGHVNANTVSGFNSGPVNNRAAPFDLCFDDAIFVHRCMPATVLPIVEHTHVVRGAPQPPFGRCL